MDLDSSTSVAIDASSDARHLIPPRNSGRANQGTTTSHEATHPEREEIAHYGDGADRSRMEAVDVGDARKGEAGASGESGVASAKDVNERENLRISIGTGKIRSTVVVPKEAESSQVSSGSPASVANAKEANISPVQQILGGNKGEERPNSKSDGLDSKRRGSRSRSRSRSRSYSSDDKRYPPRSSGQQSSWERRGRPSSDFPSRKSVDGRSIPNRASPFNRRRLPGPIRHPSPFRRYPVGPRGNRGGQHFVRGQFRRSDDSPRFSRFDRRSGVVQGRFGPRNIIAVDSPQHSDFNRFIRRDGRGRYGPRQNNFGGRSPRRNTYFRDHARQGDWDKGVRRFERTSRSPENRRSQSRVDAPKDKHAKVSPGPSKARSDRQNSTQRSVSPGERPRRDSLGAKQRQESHARARGDSINDGKSVKGKSAEKKDGGESSALGSSSDSSADGSSDASSNGTSSGSSDESESGSDDGESSGDDSDREIVVASRKDGAPEGVASSKQVKDVLHSLQASLDAVSSRGTSQAEFPKIEQAKGSVRAEVTESKASADGICELRPGKPVAEKELPKRTSEESSRKVASREPVAVKPTEVAPLSGVAAREANAQNRKPTGALGEAADHPSPVASVASDLVVSASSRMKLGDVSPAVAKTLSVHTVKESASGPRPTSSALKEDAVAEKKRLALKLDRRYREREQFVGVATDSRVALRSSHSSGVASKSEAVVRGKDAPDESTAKNVPVSTSMLKGTDRNGRAVKATDVAADAVAGEDVSVVKRSDPKTIGVLSAHLSVAKRSDQKPVEVASGHSSVIKASDQNSVEVASGLSNAVTESDRRAVGVATGRSSGVTGSDQKAVEIPSRNSSVVKRPDGDVVGGLAHGSATTRIVDLREQKTAASGADLKREDDPPLLTVGESFLRSAFAVSQNKKLADALQETLIREQAKMREELKKIDLMLELHKSHNLDSEPEVEVGKMVAAVPVKDSNKAPNKDSGAVADYRDAPQPIIDPATTTLAASVRARRDTSAHGAWGKDAGASLKPPVLSQASTDRNTSRAVVMPDTDYGNALADDIQNERSLEERGGKRKKRRKEKKAKKEKKRRKRRQKGKYSDSDAESTREEEVLQKGVGDEEESLPDWSLPEDSDLKPIGQESRILIEADPSIPEVVADVLTSLSDDESDSETETARKPGKHKYRKKKRKMKRRKRRKYQSEESSLDDAHVDEEGFELTKDEPEPEPEAVEISTNVASVTKRHAHTSNQTRTADSVIVAQEQRQPLGSMSGSKPANDAPRMVGSLKDIMDPTAYQSWVEEEKQRLREQLIRELQQELILPANVGNRLMQMGRKSSASPAVASPHGSPDYSAMQVDVEPDASCQSEVAASSKAEVATKKEEATLPETAASKAVKSKVEIQEEILDLLKSDDDSEFDWSDEDWKRQEKPASSEQMTKKVEVEGRSFRSANQAADGKHREKHSHYEGDKNRERRDDRGAGVKEKDETRSKRTQHHHRYDTAQLSLDHHRRSPHREQKGRNDSDRASRNEAGSRDADRSKDGEVFSHSRQPKLSHADKSDAAWKGKEDEAGSSKRKSDGEHLDAAKRPKQDERDIVERKTESAHGLGFGFGSKADVSRRERSSDNARLIDEEKKHDHISDRNQSAERESRKESARARDQEDVGKVKTVPEQTPMRSEETAPSLRSGTLQPTAGSSAGIEIAHAVREHVVQSGAFWRDQALGRKRPFPSAGKDAIDALEKRLDVEDQGPDLSSAVSATLSLEPKAGQDLSMVQQVPAVGRWAAPFQRVDPAADASKANTPLLPAWTSSQSKPLGTSSRAVDVTAAGEKRLRRAEDRSGKLGDGARPPHDDRNVWSGRSGADDRLYDEQDRSRRRSNDAARPPAESHAREGRAQYDSRDQECMEINAAYIDEQERAQAQYEKEKYGLLSSESGGKRLEDREGGGYGVPNREPFEAYREHSPRQKIDNADRASGDAQNERGYAPDSRFDKKPYNTPASSTNRAPEGGTYIKGLRGNGRRIKVQSHSIFERAGDDVDTFRQQQLSSDNDGRPGRESFGRGAFSSSSYNNKQTDLSLRDDSSSYVEPPMSGVRSRDERRRPSLERHQESVSYSSAGGGPGLRNKRDGGDRPAYGARDTQHVSHAPFESNRSNFDLHEASERSKTPFMHRRDYPQLDRGSRDRGGGRPRNFNRGGAGRRGDGHRVGNWKPPADEAIFSSAASGSSSPDTESDHETSEKLAMAAKMQQNRAARNYRIHKR